MWQSFHCSCRLDHKFNVSGTQNNSNSKLNPKSNCDIHYI